MNRSTFLKTLVGLVAAPVIASRVLAKPIQCPEREVFMETYVGDVLIRRMYIDEIQWMYVKDGPYRPEKMHSNVVGLHRFTPVGLN